MIQNKSLRLIEFSILNGNLRINLFRKIILVMGRCNMKRGKFGRILIGTLTVGMLMSQGIPYNVLAEEVNTSTLTGIDDASSILKGLTKEQRNALKH